MSGGTTVKTADSGGGSPILHKRSAEGRGDRCLRPEPNGGLGLDGGRGRRPPKQGKLQPVEAGIRSVQGMEAGWPRLQARLTTARPEGCVIH